jgi:ribosomal protein L29
MRLEELREKKKEELEEILNEKKKKFQKLRFDLAEKKLKNFREIRKTKREIAKILQILKEKCQKEF